MDTFAGAFSPEEIGAKHHRWQLLQSGPPFQKPFAHRTGSHAFTASTSQVWWDIISKSSAKGKAPSSSSEHKTYSRRLHVSQGWGSTLLATSASLALTIIVRQDACPSVLERGSSQVSGNFSSAFLLRMAGLVPAGAVDEALLPATQSQLIHSVREDQHDLRGSGYCLASCLLLPGVPKSWKHLQACFLPRCSKVRILQSQRARLLKARRHASKGLTLGLKPGLCL